MQSIYTEFFGMDVKVNLICIIPILSFSFMGLEFGTLYSYVDDFVEILFTNIHDILFVQLGYINLWEDFYRNFNKEFNRTSLGKTTLGVQEELRK